MTTPGPPLDKLMDRAAKLRPARGVGTDIRAPSPDLTPEELARRFWERGEKQRIEAAELRAYERRKFA